MSINIRLVKTVPERGFIDCFGKSLRCSDELRRIALDVSIVNEGDLNIILIINVIMILY